MSVLIQRCSSKQARKSFNLAPDRSRLQLSSRLLVLTMALLLAASLQAQTTARKASFTSYEEARPVIQALGDIMPAQLRAASPAEIPAVWAKWAAGRDAEIRARLIQGDE